MIIRIRAAAKGQWKTHPRQENPLTSQIQGGIGENTMENETKHPTYVRKDQRPQTTQT